MNTRDIHHQLSFPSPPKLRRCIACTDRNAPQYSTDREGEIISGWFDLKDRTNADLKLISYQNHAATSATHPHAQGT